MVAYLDEEAVRKALAWDELIEAMQAALASFSRGQAAQPMRATITIEEGKRYFLTMPAATDEAMGAKLVSLYPGNAGSSAPTHMAMIALFRPDTGEPLAIMDGRLITEMRTAAVSAAVTRSLAPPDARILALLGSGVQAESHLAALRRVRKLSEVRVWSPTRANAERFAAAHGCLAAPDARAAVQGADIIVTATAATKPVLEGAWLKPGAHVNAVGAPRPNWRELDDIAMRAGAVIVDSREAALAESGDVILSRAPIFAEAGEIFSGAPKPPAGTTTIFKSLGMAVEDIAAAYLVHRAAKARA